MPTRLRQLLIDQIALVDKGANPDAHVVLYKRADEPPPVETPVAKAMDEPAMPKDILAAREAVESWSRIHAAFMESFYKITEQAEPAEQPALLARAVAEFAELAGAMPALAKRAAAINAQVQALVAEAKAVEKIGRKISASRLQRLREMVTMLQDMIKEAEGEEPMAKAQEEFEAQLSELRKRAETAEAQLAAVTEERDALQAKLAKASDEPEDIWKGVNPQLKAQFEALEKQAKAAEEVAKAERERRERSDYIALVKSADYAALPMKPDDDWEVLRAIDSLPEHLSKRIKELLRSASEITKQAQVLTQEIGRGGTAVTGGAYAQLVAAADDLVQKGEVPTRQQAIAKLASMHHPTYAAYQQERQQRRA